MSAHRTLKDMYRAFEAMGPGRLADPGHAGTIAFGMYGQICSVVTTAGQTRTLAQPDRPGIIGTICLDTDGGDLTLTVTGGYNQDADTVIALTDAGDFVTFISIKVGSSYYWRVLASAEELAIPSTSPSHTVSRTPSHTVSRTPSHTVSATPSQTPSHTVSATPSHTVSATPSQTPSHTVSATPSHTVSATPSQTPSHTPSTT